MTSFLLLDLILMRRKISVSKLLKSNKLIKVWLQIALNKIGIKILIPIKFIKFIRILNLLYKRKIRPVNIIIKSASKQVQRNVDDIILWVSSNIDNIFADNCLNNFGKMFFRAFKWKHFSGTAVREFARFRKVHVFEKIQDKFRVWERPKRWDFLKWEIIYRKHSF